MKSVVKKIIPQKAISFRRLGKERNILRDRLRDFENGCHSGDIVLIGTPLHENLGDHLITLGVREFISSSCPNKNVIEIPLEAYRVFWRSLKRGMAKDNIILINGGGWMGDVYPEDEAVIWHVAKNFPENKIVILPQTIFYNDIKSSIAQNLIREGRNVFSRAEKIDLCLREVRSLQMAYEIYPRAQSYLVPDMALAYCDKVPKDITTPNGRVGVCLRLDKEKCLDDFETDKIVETLRKTGKTVVPITTMAGRKVYSYEREVVVQKKLKEFAACDVVVTDRLHAMLFAFLANTPCVAFDNSTKKLSGVYNTWLQAQHGVELLANPNDLGGVLELLEKRLEDDRVNFSSFDYSILKELISDEQN